MSSREEARQNAALRLKEAQENPAKMLGQIVEAAQGGKLSWEEGEDLQMETQWIAAAAAMEINAAKSPDWVHPTPERLAVIGKWRRILRPFNGVLLDFATNIKNDYPDTLVAEARRLLSYTEPDDVFLNRVRSVLSASTSSSRKRLAMAELLREHRQLTDEDRAALAAVGPRLKSDEAKLAWAAGIAEFGLDDGLPYLLEELRKPLNPDRLAESQSNHMTALGGAAWLGTRAASLLPEIERARAETERLDPSMVRNYDVIIETVKGLRHPDRREAVNGSGYLDEPMPPLPGEESAVPPSPVPTPPVPSPQLPTAPSLPSLPAAPPAAEPIASSGPSLLPGASFVLLALALLAALAFLWNRRR